jgi:hypothetical protein
MDDGKKQDSKKEGEGIRDQKLGSGFVAQFVTHRMESKQL